jgi:hypothetical protein
MGRPQENFVEVNTANRHPRRGDLLVEGSMPGHEFKWNPRGANELHAAAQSEDIDRIL